MAKLKKVPVLNNFSTEKEVPIDKTTRIVKEILDEETSQRHVKMARLRKARLESEAGEHPEALEPTAASQSQKKS